MLQESNVKWISYKKKGNNSNTEIQSKSGSDMIICSSSPTVIVILCSAFWNKFLHLYFNELQSFLPCSLEDSLILKVIQHECTTRVLCEEKEQHF